MTIRFAEDRDLPAIAAIHKSQFAGHFLGSYSRRLLEAYYRSFLDHSLFLVHETAGVLDGFVLGTTQSEQSACRVAFICANRWRGLCETLARPTMWIEAARRVSANIRAFRSNSTRSTVSSAPSSIDILSIAVKKEAMGNGTRRRVNRGLRAVPSGKASEGIRALCR